MAVERVTVYFSLNERSAIRRLAKHNGTSDNYIVRLAVREFLHLPIPAGMSIADPPTPTSGAYHSSDDRSRL